MPNWVMCDLVIYGPEDELKRFKAFATSKAIDTGLDDDRVLDFNNFEPYPESFKGDDGFNRGGYEWCCEHWGCKWNASSAGLLTETDKEISYCLDTAWSPPRAIVKKMGEMFPLLEFVLKFMEPGNGFKGTFSMKEAKVVTDDTFDFEQCPECGWDPETCGCEVEKKCLNTANP